MISEGALRAGRIHEAIVKFAKAKGVSEHELEHIAFVMLVALILRDDSRTPAYLSTKHANELDRLVSDIVNVGSDDCANKLAEVNHLLLNAMHASESTISDVPGASVPAIRHIAGMLLHELQDLDAEGRNYVVDTLFYKLFLRLLPSHPRHHKIVARLAAPLAELYDGVSESQPGPGEVFTLSGTPDWTSYNYPGFLSGLPPKLRESYRFIRNLRLAVLNIRFEKSDSASRARLSLIDTTFRFARSAYGNAPMLFLDENSLEGLATLRQEHDSPMVVVVGGQDMRPTKYHEAYRRELVENLGLRAVIDFNSLGARASKTLSLWYFGPRFPRIQDRIVHMDARHLSSNAKSEDALACASLVGVLLRSWAEGGHFPKSQLEGTGAPRRIIAFIEEALATEFSSVPGFIRFVSLREMEQQDYSLRAQDYLEKKEDRSWQPDVEINPILSCLRRDRESMSVYLIGNNGAGKSLAMRDLAMALALEKRSTFGVSFGSTDRFDRSPHSEPLKSYFTYAGARTFRSGPNVRRSLGELGDMVKDIYQDPARLACFEMALDTLGFRPRHFLVPVRMNSTSDHWERLIADVYPLSARSATKEEKADRKRWSTLPNGAYKLALARRDSPEILVFDSLSSGEQQILTIVIKIVANVQRKTSVLLDEPEISLHVAWQRQLPHILGEFSRQLGCSFVVATHSPVIIASASGLNDQCFVIENRSIQELKQEQRRSVEASLFEGFNTYTPYTHHIQERCAEIVSRVIGEADEDGNVRDTETAAIAQLKSLRSKLDAARWQGTVNDIALVDTALAAIKEILDL